MNQHYDAHTNIALIGAALFSVAHAQPWKPNKTVELVVGSAPGGAPDVMARVVLNIFQNTGLNGVTLLKA